jgi:hypothetical protein
MPWVGLPSFDVEQQNTEPSPQPEQVWVTLSVFALPWPTVSIVELHPVHRCLAVIVGISRPLDFETVCIITVWHLAAHHDELVARFQVLKIAIGGHLRQALKPLGALLSSLSGDPRKPEDEQCCGPDVEDGSTCGIHVFNGVGKRRKF